MLGLLVLLVVSSATLAVSACSCGPEQEVELALEQAHNVFTGRVTELKLIPKLSEDPTASFAVEDLEVTFAVSFVWKGEVEETNVVYTAFTCCVCGFPFEIGEQYLVYTTQTTDGLPATSVCSRTRRLADAADDLVALGPAKTSFQTLTDVLWTAPEGDDGENE